MREHLKRALSSTVVAVAVAFLVRMVILHHVFRTALENTVMDPRFGAETGAVAASIAAGRGFSSPLKDFLTGPTAWFTPIYPYLLAGIFKLFGAFSYKSDILIRTLDCAFSAFTCWPIFSIGKDAFGKKAGLAAAWLWAVLPTAVFFPVYWVWDTALAGLWMALLVAMTLKLRGSERRGFWIAYGAMWAIGAEINPSLLSVLPFLALWAIWPLRAHFARAAKLALPAAAIFIAGLAPWAIRNYVVFHKFIPLRSNFGLELWLGNNPEVPDGWSPTRHPNDNLFEGAKYARMTEIPYMAEKEREGWGFVRSHPGEFAGFTFRRFAYNWTGFWDPVLDVWKSAPAYVRATLLANCLFSLLSLLGVLFAYRAQNPAAVPFGMVLVIFPLIFYVTHTSLRYRLPIDTIMAVLAVYAVAYPLSQWAGRRHTDTMRHSSGEVATLPQSVAGKIGG